MRPPAGQSSAGASAPSKPAPIASNQPGMRARAPAASACDAIETSAQSVPALAAITNTSAENIVTAPGWPDSAIACTKCPNAKPAANASGVRPSWWRTEAGAGRWFTAAVWDRVRIMPPARRRNDSKSGPTLHHFTRSAIAFAP